KLDIVSYQVRPGDNIQIGPRASSQQLGLRMLDITQSVPLMDWITLDRDKMEGTVSRLPEKDDLDAPVNLQLIVELYSR
ncbi:30S ribosomal protein S4, partial [bacterium]|nr:30S ribosomal protein S4 [bacterium]